MEKIFVILGYLFVFGLWAFSVLVSITLPVLAIMWIWNNL